MKSKPAEEIFALSGIEVLGLNSSHVGPQDVTTHDLRLKIWQLGICSHERQGLFSLPAPTGQITNQDGPATGRLPKSNSELRAGVEENPVVHRAPASISSGFEAEGPCRGQMLLGDAELPDGSSQKVPRVGI